MGNGYKKSYKCRYTRWGYCRPHVKRPEKGNHERLRIDLSSWRHKGFPSTALSISLTKRHLGAESIFENGSIHMLLFFAEWWPWAFKTILALCWNQIAGLRWWRGTHSLAKRCNTQSHCLWLLVSSCSLQSWGNRAECTACDEMQTATLRVPASIWDHNNYNNPNFSKN